LRFEGDITVHDQGYELAANPQWIYFNMSQGTALPSIILEHLILRLLPPLPRKARLYPLPITPLDLLRHYLWWFGDGEVSEEQNPVHQYEDGLFEATLIVSNACQSDTTYLEILILTGTKDIQGDETVTISPNPTDGRFSVLMKEDLQSPFQIYLYASDGSLVFEKKEVTSNESISLTGLDAGVYTVLITQHNQQFRKKLVLIASK
jgi:hypothetical protein